MGGRYLLESLLGLGGMAAVYRAHHQELGTAVAIKMLHPRFCSNADLTTRFRLEAQKVAELRHPGIVQVHDLGVDEDGSPFMAMELLDGSSLGELIDAGVGTMTRAVSLICQALEGLSVAHEQGVVHRDIKPDNLFMSTDTAGGEQVKILDFGIAKVLREGTGSDLTRTGNIMGTVSYMSPEQLTDSKHVDARADLYSIGATLFELLTGAKPVSGDSHMQVLAQVVGGKIDRHPGAHNPDIPAWLDELVARALSEDPGDRFPDAAEMLAALSGGQVPGEVILPGRRELGDRVSRDAAGPASSKISTPDVFEETVAGPEDVELAAPVKAEELVSPERAGPPRSRRLLVVLPALLAFTAAGVILGVTRPWQGSTTDDRRATSSAVALDAAAAPDTRAPASKVTRVVVNAGGAGASVSVKTASGAQEREVQVVQKKTVRNRRRRKVEARAVAEVRRSARVKPPPPSRRTFTYLEQLRVRKKLAPAIRQACGRGVQEYVSMIVIVKGATGRVQRVTIQTTRFVDTKVGRCLTREVRRRVRFPPFNKRLQAFHWQLKLWP